MHERLTVPERVTSAPALGARHTVVGGVTAEPERISLCLIGMSCACIIGNCVRGISYVLELCCADPPIDVLARGELSDAVASLESASIVLPSLEHVSIVLPVEWVSIARTSTRVLRSVTSSGADDSTADVLADDDGTHSESDSIL